MRPSTQSALLRGRKTFSKAGIKCKLVTRETLRPRYLTIPAKNKPTKMNALTYWNDKLQSLKTREAELYRKFQLDSNELNARELCAAKQEFKKANKYFKRKSFRKWTSSRDTVAQVSWMRKILNSKGSNKLDLLKRTDGSITLSPEDSINKLFNINFPTASKADPPKREEFEHFDFEYKEFSWITMERAKPAINGFAPHKAASEDKIKPLILKSLPDSVIKKLLVLYNTSLSSSYTPWPWRNSKTVMLGKLGRRDPSQPKAWRPITLSSHVFKLLEKLCLWQIEEKAQFFFIFIHSLLLDNQHRPCYGFSVHRHFHFSVKCPMSIKVGGF